MNGWVKIFGTIPKFLKRKKKKKRHMQYRILPKSVINALKIQDSFASGGF